MIFDSPIPVIDLFAGPGGLGEGFSAFNFEDKKSVFTIKLSIEKDRFAHQTLELRAFYRQFLAGTIPSEYYEYLKGKISRSNLFDKYPHEALNAKKEAWLAELGETSPVAVKTRIEEALYGSPVWILIGGPPCQAYSLVGRSRIRGESKQKYAKDHRHFLYKQYLNILADHQPPVFIMENVKGLLSSKRVEKENTFDLILADLKHPNDVKRKGSKSPLSYKLFSMSKKQDADTELEPKDYVIRSEEYGIPQARHRIIIFGIREDIYKSVPGTLEKVAQKITINDVIGNLPRLRSGLSKKEDSAEAWEKAIARIEKAKWVKTASPEFKKALKNALKKISSHLSRGKTFVQSNQKPKELSDWYIDKNLGGICNHESRSHIEKDLHRYLFASIYARINRRSPTLNNFPRALLPKHNNVKEALKGSKFNDRFRVQRRGEPSTTVVSHISKDGHYYIHYDPTQCRSLTVREAARLQTFPDNYFFEGNRTQQYHQVGNAVPPLLAKKIAEIVFDVLKNTEQDNA
jgi:DNA (cytosine-5)-methyltransferase 1